MSGALTGFTHMQWSDALMHREQVGFVSSHLIFRLLQVTQARDLPALTMEGDSTPADPAAGPSESCGLADRSQNGKVS